jgi:hypothetical protein
MKKPFRQLSAFLLVSALTGMVVLLVFDVLNRLSLTSIHQRVGALSFMLIGASYISLQLSRVQPWKEKLKRVLLGVGFFLWGGEQFLSPGPLVTFMDSLVVIIFVSDLSLVIVDSLRCKDDEVP